MLHSNNFQETTITINGNNFRMEYDVAPAIENSIRGFGNIYLNEEDPFEFTFFTLNNQIAGFTPINAEREFIADIVQAAIGNRLFFENQ